MDMVIHKRWLECEEGGQIVNGVLGSDLCLILSIWTVWNAKKWLDGLVELDEMGLNVLNLDMSRRIENNRGSI